MVDIFINLQVNIFTNTANIKPDTSTIAKLLELFKDEGFIPNTIQEISPKGPVFRLRMSSQDNRWNIVFLSKQINVEQVGVPQKTGKEVDDFLSKAKNIIEKTLGYLKQKSNRLAFIVNAILEDKTQVELENFYNRIFIPLPTHKSNPPFEWNNRSVSRNTISIVGASEDVNIITEIYRMKGQMNDDGKITEMDRAHLSYEFNTAPDNKETRFGASEIDVFLGIAKENYCKISKELGAIING